MMFNLPLPHPKSQPNNSPVPIVFSPECWDIVDIYQFNHLSYDNFSVGRELESNLRR